MSKRNRIRVPKISTVAMLAVIAAGCNNSGPANEISTEANLTEDPAANDVLGSNDVAGAAALPTDSSGFTSAVAASDMFEIESGELARDKASSANLKTFGKQLMDDHTKSTAELKTAAGEANVTVTPALDAEKRGMLDELKAASGADFDRLFIEQQAAAHQKALALLQNYSASGDNPALKGFATKATAVVQGHLDHVNGMKN